MTTISHSVAPADVRAAPKAKARNFSIDRTRTFLTLVVLIHHAVIPYTYFGHTDPKSWIGFDCIVLATDSFFHGDVLLPFRTVRVAGPCPQGAGDLLRDRLLRLGLPFTIAAFTVIPLAYYAISLRQQPDVGFAAFYWKTITVGPWQAARSGSSGCCWFST